eukprot:3545075-Prymnesium_polylepis.1
MRPSEVALVVLLSQVGAARPGALRSISPSPCSRVGATFNRVVLMQQGKPRHLPFQMAKLTLFTGCTAASLSSGGPPAATLGHAFLGPLAAALPGALDTHLAVGYGYGASMIWQALLFRQALAATGLAARLLGLAYILYGAKVCLFQAARDIRPAYVAKALAPARAKKGGFLNPYGLARQVG